MAVAAHVPTFADIPADAFSGLAGARPRDGLETAFDVDRGDLVAVLTALRDTHEYQQLMEIAGVDYPDRAERFEVVYCLLSLTKNHRVRVHVSTDETSPVPSVTGLWPVAGWLEREVFDMYGVPFSGNPDLRRILTDYGFEGHPQRKDFPLTGYVELRYSEADKRVVYEPVDLPQDFRSFDFLMPWQGPEYQLPGDEKAKPEETGAPSTAAAPTGDVKQNPKTSADVPKTTEKPSDTGGGAPANREAKKAARKSNAKKAENQVDKDDSQVAQPNPKSPNRRRPTGGA
ncbi:NADH-quinone oxidoreductase subunit C [Sphingomonas sabuli]|uniref:NADH-quinone oxidoreductase subunit C n=1 Tax=Sphingomonas sabuli TaxID=2764186 RepID=A0A7G9L2U0_9SPHN|nr:NADH-quinone oxidoreductase subunit C [Sphingomonas sabuli]QNM82939.1 NADH-quinone oxidoreductase subunit C [Sphingomonas sabuli]